MKLPKKKKKVDVCVSALTPFGLLTHSFFNIIKKYNKSGRFKDKNSNSVLKGMVNLSLIRRSNLGARHFNSYASVFSLIK